MFKYRTWFNNFFFFFFFPYSQMLRIPKCRPEQKQQNITFKICASFTVIFFSISLTLSLSLTSFFFFFYIFVFISFLFRLELENCCLYTNPVLVLNLIQLFLYKTVIIYVCADENRCLCVIVYVYGVGGRSDVYLYGVFDYNTISAKKKRQMN